MSFINRVHNEAYIQIFESWATTENPFNSTSEILQWIEAENDKKTVLINKIKYTYDGYWYYNHQQKGIVNKSNSFFKIVGVKYSDENIDISQPIIIQDEIGYLGIIGKVFNGILYFLMQAKVEPGNINKIQISPTLQATRSNFMRAHGGKEPAYLSFFSHKNKHHIIADQIQSEQSSRFLGKRNRNIIIIVEDDIEVFETHKWMTLGQIKELMHYDNLVNMDTRTVLSCIPFSLRDYTYREINQIHNIFKTESFFNSLFFGDAVENINRLYQYMNDVKMMRKAERRLVDLKSLTEWKYCDDGEIKTENGNFKIVYCNISISGREVNEWSQPLLESTGKSILGLMYYVDEQERMQFLVQAKSEVGCFDMLEVAPSIQKEPSEYRITNCVEKVFFNNLKANSESVIFSGVFSEEGGRFYHEQNQNIIMRIKKDDIPSLPEGYFWFDFQTLNLLIQFNNCLNIQLRNLMSIMDL